MDYARVGKGLHSATATGLGLSLLCRDGYNHAAPLGLREGLLSSSICAFAGERVGNLTCFVIALFAR